MTKIHLKGLIVPNPKYWMSGLPNYAFMEPRESRTRELWRSMHLFCPMSRYILVEKGKRYANKKS